MYTRDVSVVSSLVEHARLEYMEMSQPHVIIHTTNVSCLTVFPYSISYCGSSVPIFLSTGTSVSESLVVLWNLSFLRKAFWIPLFLMLVNS